MNKIKAYAVATGENANKLAANVNVMIGNGFQPLGSIAASVNDHDIVYLYQAMVKYEQASN